MFIRPVNYMDNNFFQQFLSEYYDAPAFLVNENYDLLEVNNAFISSFQVSDTTDEQVNNFKDLIPDQHKFQQWEELFEKAKKSSHAKMVYQLINDEGTKIMEFKAFHISENTGIKFMIMANDISDNNDFERQLAEQNFKLKKINEELDNFVYSVSHQIRAPLSSLLGLINVAKIDTSSKVSDYLELMQHSIENLDHTVHEINDYSKNTRLGLKIEPIDFKEIWDKVIRDFDYGKQLNSFKIFKNIENCADFYSDQSRISVIISNLFSNSLKFNDLEKNEPTIKVNIVANEQSAKIVVSDNGEGMEESVLPKIFDMFYRATRSARGAGLGLYIVKEIVNKLNGEIGVTSSSGKGTSFTVKLPNLKSIEN